MMADPSAFQTRSYNSFVISSRQREGPRFLACPVGVEKPI